MPPIGGCSRGANELDPVAWVVSCPHGSRYPIGMSRHMCRLSASELSGRCAKRAAAVVALIVLCASPSSAQSAVPAAADHGATEPTIAPFACASKEGQRTRCPADTSAGVALMKSTGPSACILGNTWGYDKAGVWVTDGCSGEFQIGQSAAAPAPPTPEPTPTPIASWDEFTPGDGFLVGRGDAGSISLSG